MGDTMNEMGGLRDTIRDMGGVVDIRNQQMNFFKNISEFDVRPKMRDYQQNLLRGEEGEDKDLEDLVY